jgi:hypothetical protein
MAREDLHFRLRIPEDLKSEVEAHAQANGRSMTAEIVHRLKTYDELKGRAKDLERLSTLNATRAQKFKGLVDRLHDRLSGVQDRTLYIAIDAEGLPTSWPEVMKHIDEVQAVLGVAVDRIEARVVDAKMERSDEREEELLRIVRWYRNLRKKAL